MLTIFYTHNLQGNLELLPRLYTYIKELRGMGEARLAPADYHFLLLDLGNSCSADVWHCAVTGGRSTLIVMDAIGYHAAHVSLDADAREKLRDNRLGLALVDGDHPWQDDNILITSELGGGGSETLPYNLHLVLAPAAETLLDRHRLSLRGVNTGQIGMALVDEHPLLIDHDVYDLPPDTLPDPTITATIDFVLNEARLLQRKQQG